MAATQPSSDGDGKLLIPLETFYRWCSTFLPTGAYYTFGKPKEKGENLEVTYNFSTTVTPPQPLEVDTK